MGFYFSYTRLTVVVCYHHEVGGRESHSYLTGLFYSVIPYTVHPQPHLWSALDIVFILNSYIKI